MLINFRDEVSVDYATSEALMNIPLIEDIDMIENVAAYHHLWTNGRDKSLRRISRGKFEVDSVDLILAKFDALNQYFDKLEKYSLNLIGGTKFFCEVYEVIGTILLLLYFSCKYQIIHIFF